MNGNGQIMTSCLEWNFWKYRKKCFSLAPNIFVFVIVLVNSIVIVLVNSIVIVIVEKNIIRIDENFYL